MSTDLGDMPEPSIEPGEPSPGGVDAIEDRFAAAKGPVVPDLGPEDNPAVDDAAPEELKQSDKTDTGPSSDGATEPEKEAQA